MAAEQKLNGWERASHVKGWGKNIPGWGEGGQQQLAKARGGRNKKEALVSEMQRSGGRTRDEAREVFRGRIRPGWAGGSPSKALALISDCNGKSQMEAFQQGWGTV